MRTPSSTAPEHYARVHGSAGEQPRLRGLMRLALPLLAAVAAAGYLLRAALPLPPLKPPMVGGLLLGLALGLALAVRAARVRLGAFLKGARGEEGVARVLGMLPATYDVFHGLTPRLASRAADGDLDHVVVGPTGVFVIETKHWSGPVTIADDQILNAGQAPSRPPLAQARAAADTLRALLRAAGHDGVDVQPILCFAAASGDVLRVCGVGGVLVCGDRLLLGAILEHGEAALSPARQAQIVAALRAATA